MAFHIACTCCCSGHGITWMMTVVTVTTFYPYGFLKYVVWAAYVQTSLRTAIEGWHYSVDFVLPAVLCWYVWRDLAWVYPTSASLSTDRRNVQEATRKIIMVVLIIVVSVSVVAAFFVGS
jgi:hypothetical protein